MTALPVALLDGDRGLVGGGQSSFRWLQTMEEPDKIFGKHDDNTLAQLAQVAERARKVALMADGHLGYVMPIGGVAAYDNPSPWLEWVRHRLRQRGDPDRPDGGGPGRHRQPRSLAG